MKPLQEETTFASQSERTLAELVRNSSGYQPSPFRKRLIRTRIAATGRAHPARSLRFAGVAALLVCTSAAAATLGYRFVAAPAEEAATAAPAPPTPPEPRAPARAATPQEPREPADTELEATPRAEERPQVAKSRGPAEREKPKSDAPKVDPEDPSQMLQAVRALRKEGNPEQAQKLLDGYLSSHPTGALAEDALALSIEAATARRDARAADYARRYLAQYPNGRFRDVAQRALAAGR